MIRWLLLFLGGALLGGIVHLATVIIMPRTATQDAYSRLTPIAPVNTVTALPAPAPDTALMPFMDPAFASAVCRYDLSQGSLKLTVPVSLAYTSTPEQHGNLPEDEEITAADRLIVESPTPTGLIAIRALAPEPGLLPMAQSAIAAARCAIQQDGPKPSR